MSFQNSMAPPARALGDDSDEENLVADYQEQVRYENMDDLESMSVSMAQQTDDIQSRLVSAAQPLDFSASLEIKFQSYDSYCSLFHFILNSDRPVDLEPPSVCCGHLGSFLYCITDSPSCSLLFNDTEAQ